MKASLFVTSRILWEDIYIYISIIYIYIYIYDPSLLAPLMPQNEDLQP